jgi:hypothetical protein
MIRPVAIRTKSGLAVATPPMSIGLFVRDGGDGVACWDFEWLGIGDLSWRTPVEALVHAQLAGSARPAREQDWERLAEAILSAWAEERARRIGRAHELGLHDLVVPMLEVERAP